MSKRSWPDKVGLETFLDHLIGFGTAIGKKEVGLKKAEIQVGDQAFDSAFEIGVMLCVARRFKESCERLSKERWITGKNRVNDGASG